MDEEENEIPKSQKWEWDWDDDDWKFTLKNMPEAHVALLRQMVNDAAEEQQLLSSGYIRICPKKETIISAEWCEKNIKHDYKVINYKWFFIDRQDAAWFLLHWK